jgi:hypothetical protein
MRCGVRTYARPVSRQISVSTGSLVVFPCRPGRLRTIQHVQSSFVVPGGEQQRGYHSRIQVPAMLFDGGIQT